MSRFQKTLLIILAVQLLVIVAIYWPRGEAVNSGRPLLGNLTVEKISAITLDDKNKNHMELIKQGADWQFKIQGGGYPAGTDKIKPVLEKILSIQTNRLVTHTVSSHKQLQVAKDDYVQRVQLTTLEGTNYILYIGSSPGLKATHVRLDGQNEVYLTDKITADDVNTEARTWIDTNYLSVPIDQIENINIKNGNGGLEFKRDANKNWTLVGLTPGETFDTGKMDALLNQFSALSMSEPLSLDEKPEYGLANPLATVTLKIKSEAGVDKTIVLNIGVKDEGKGDYIVKSSESKYYIKVSAYNLQDIVGFVRSNFIQAIPTPTSGLEITPTSSITVTPETNLSPTVPENLPVQSTPTRLPTSVPGGSLTPTP